MDVFDELNVVVERRATGVRLYVHVPTELVGPAAEMLDATWKQLGPSGSSEGVAVAAGALAGLLDSARVTSAMPAEELSRTAA